MITWKGIIMVPITRRNIMFFIEDYKGDKVFLYDPITKSGKEIDVSGDHYKNKLSAVIEILEDKSSTKTLIGRDIVYLLDWISNLIDLQCKGVHSNITREHAERCILQTYMCLGDILNMQNDAH